MANKIYTNTEYINQQTFLPTGVYKLDVRGLLSGSGYISTNIALPTFPRATMYRWEALTRASGTTTVGNTLEMYWRSCDNQNAVPGNLVTTEVGLGNVNVKRNLQWIGAIVSDKANQDNPFAADGIVEIYAASGAVVWFNHLGASLSSGINDHYIRFTPIPAEIQ